MLPNHEFSPLGDSGVIVKLGDVIDQKTHEKVVTFSEYLQKHPFPGMIEFVPSFTTMTVYYDPVLLFDPKSNVIPYERVLAILGQMVGELQKRQMGEDRLVEIPVCYGGSFGPDLEAVATHNGLSSEEVIAIHSSTEYLVYMIGFAPGFPYLGGMDERLATPRRSSPRLAIPMGSVGIGGSQTGIYSVESPGGWQIIGRTPQSLFQPDDKSPSLLRSGDKVRFRPISEREYDDRKKVSL
ncbi:5-oxoprolinase subunit PxpB [Brevibacillus sp. NRS-1366]|uniref:5-oxoprolinase subunit PxpB n=1 Tax=Brevibacillus sp. NRS-1366 TaxID=3233899 RepID=UPI003D24AB3C